MIAALAFSWVGPQALTVAVLLGTLVVVLAFGYFQRYRS